MSLLERVRVNLAGSVAREPTGSAAIAMAWRYVENAAKAPITRMPVWMMNQ